MMPRVIADSVRTESRLRDCGDAVSTICQARPSRAYAIRGPAPQEAPLEVKKTVRELLERLPDDCTLDDVLYHLHVVQAIQLGRQDVAKGRVASHAEVAQQLRKRWLTGTVG